MGNSMSTRQKAWLEATQRRINFTTEVLASVKSVKLLGLTETMEAMIEQSRLEELQISKKYRRLQALRINIGMHPSPPNNSNNDLTREKSQSSHEYRPTRHLCGVRNRCQSPGFKQSFSYTSGDVAFAHQLVDLPPSRSALCYSGHVRLYWLY